MIFRSSEVVTSNTSSCLASWRLTLFQNLPGGKNIGADDSQSSSSLDNFRARDKQFTTRGPQQIHFEFNTQHARSGGHQGICRVSGRGVRHGRDHSRVKVSVLLSQIRAKRQLNFDDAWFDPSEPRANQIHD